MIAEVVAEGGDEAKKAKLRERLTNLMITQQEKQVPLIPHWRGQRSQSWIKFAIASSHFLELSENGNVKLTKVEDCCQLLSAPSIKFNIKQQYSSCCVANL